MPRQKVKTCFLLAASAAFAWLMPAASVCAEEVDKAKALKVKAAYLYNFAKFVEWPDNAFENEKAPLVIGVLGDDPFGRILDNTAKDKHVAEHPVKIRRFRWNKQEDRAGLKNCHILFISGSEQNRLAKILTALKERPVLVVSDIHNFARDGGMVGFVLEKGRIAFEINREVLEKAKLKASSRLLKLARIVEPRRRST